MDTSASFPTTRRRFLQNSAAMAAAASLLPGDELRRDWDWIRSCRCLIAEAYNPPFYPKLDYRADKAVEIATALGADSLRYPAASYFAYFPTQTEYPRHPELGASDPFRDTVDRCRKAGLKVIAYVPLNHPFMEVRANDPRYMQWVKRFADGKPMTTEHYGFTPYYEGCLNSPVRDQIRAMVREVLLRYEVDVMYFDGPYMGMRNARQYCHCEHCVEAYRKARGKAIPRQDASLRREDEIEYVNWMARDVVIGFLREIRGMIRRERDVPVLYNDTSLLSRREWRNRAIPEVDGFMFEAAETPEEKLFNLSLGNSTGKVIWTYVGTHTQYNREHMKNERVRGWFSYPVESEELLLDGATALAGNAGLKYWGLSRFFYQQKPPTDFASGRYVREVFDLAAKHRELFLNQEARKLAGVLVGSQTVDWYDGKLHLGSAYENYFHGAWQMLKELSYDAEPFLDYRLTASQLAGYKLLYVPNAPCLSDAQCGLIRDWVGGGGVLVATHLTSTCDEYGRARADFGLADVFGAARQANPEAVEIPDLYLRFGAGEELPQDPQVVRFRALDPKSVIAETIERGEHQRVLGPAIIRRSFGKGTVLYIGSGLEAIYAETRMAPVRDFIGSLLDPLVGKDRAYRVDPRPGLLAHYVTSGKDTLILHLLANTGNKWKKLRLREEYLPIADVKVRVAVPAGRKVRQVRLLRAGRALGSEVRAASGWLEVTVPRVLIHEAVVVDLA